DEDEAEGDQAVDAADREAVQDQLKNNVQKRALLGGPVRGGQAQLPRPTPAAYTDFPWARQSRKHWDRRQVFDGRSNLYAAILVFRRLRASSHRGPGCAGKKEWRSPNGRGANRHFRVALRPVARDLLPARLAGGTRAPVRLRATWLGRDQRLLLLAPAPGKLPQVVRRDAGRLRLRGEGRPLHHAHEAARRRGRPAR